MVNCKKRQKNWNEQDFLLAAQPHEKVLIFLRIVFCFYCNCPFLKKKFFKNNDVKLTLTARRQCRVVAHAFLMLKNQNKKATKRVQYFVTFIHLFNFGYNIYIAMYIKKTHKKSSNYNWYSFSWDTFIIFLSNLYNLFSNIDFALVNISYCSLGSIT